VLHIIVVYYSKIATFVFENGLNLCGLSSVTFWFWNG